ncbi:helix-turn-helix domain-containing protein [Planktotalea arctica]|uniref:helix-turn-helix domain-containing protein n=1 Tax=Planktotalea arctica TaxID=1481893 RepID=UPI003D2F9034
MLIKSALTYEICEAAQVLGVTPGTIRNWIKDGLPIMSERKPYLILGDAIKTYLRAKRRVSKRPLEANELFCPSCKSGRHPLSRGMTSTLIASGSHLFKGTCSACGSGCSRIVAARDFDAFAATFRFAKGASGDP